MSHHEEEISISFFDLKWIFLSHKQKLKKTLLSIAIVMAFFLLLKEPVYQARATFRSALNKTESQLDIKNLVKNVLAQAQEDFALSIMQSDTLLHSLVQNMGLQATVKTTNPLFFVMQRGLENLLTEFFFPLADRGYFSFKNVRYEGESPLHLSLIFSDEETFQLLNSRKEVLATGKIGERALFSEGELTLQRKPKKIKTHFVYPLTIKPMDKAIVNLRKRLEIKPSKTDQNLLILTFCHRDRDLGREFLNSLMDGYQAFLKNENNELVAAQIAYLEKRQNDLGNKFDEQLKEHVHYLQKNLGESGFISTEQEIETLSIPKEEYVRRLFEIDMELKRLENKPRHIEIAGVIKNTLPHLRQCTNLRVLQDSYQNAQGDLSAVYTQINQFSHIRKQLDDPHFELISLASIIKNPSIVSLLGKTMELSLELSDSANRSPREIDRLKEAIAIHKKTIAHHLEQSVELCKVRAKVLEDKIAELQKTSIDFLKQEKQLIGQKLYEIGQKMRDLPEKWSLENKLELKKELSLNIIQGISTLVETKNMHQHLYQIESKPLDRASLPLRPKSSHVLLYSLLGGLCSACALYAFHLFRAVYRGLPVSYERLKKYVTVFGGKLSSHCESSFEDIEAEDLEIFRRLAQFVKEEKSPICVSLIGGSNPNFSYPFAELLAQKGHKVLLMECTFDGIIPLDHIPGLWHYLEGKVDICPIKQKGSYDFIPSGGTTRHAVEMLERENFSSLVSRLKNQYEIILLYSSAHPFSSEAYAHMKYADKLIVSTSEEPLQELQEYTLWAKTHQKEDKLIFVYFEP